MSQNEIHYTLGLPSRERSTPPKGALYEKPLSGQLPRITIPMGVGVGENTRLQHLVWAEADARHLVGWAEGRHFDLGEVVLGIAIEFHHAHLDGRIVSVRPDLGQIERV
jgi:hypothetical protein